MRLSNWRNGHKPQDLGVVTNLRYKRKQERKKEEFYVATGVSNGGASFLSWSKSIWHPETGIMRIRGPLKTIASF